GTAALAVGELAGNPEAVLRPHGHQRQAFGPAGDDLVETELRRLIAGKRTVELGAIEQGAPVVHAYAVARLRAGAGPRTQHAVLQARSGSEHALCSAVAGQEVGAGLAVGFGLPPRTVARLLLERRTRRRRLVGVEQRRSALGDGARGLHQHLQVDR